MIGAHQVQKQRDPHAAFAPPTACRNVPSRPYDS